MSLDSMGPERNGAIGTRMTHSLSTPSGVDGSSSNHRGGGKKLSVRVQMLDDSITIFQVQVSGVFVRKLILPYLFLLRLHSKNHVVNFTTAKIYSVRFQKLLILQEFE
jgi:hypothetical protein